MARKVGWYLNREFSLNPTLQTSEAADGLAHVSLIRPQNLPSVFRENFKAALTVITVETETSARRASANDCHREADLAYCAGSQSYQKGRETLSLASGKKREFDILSLSSAA